MNRLSERYTTKNYYPDGDVISDERLQGLGIIRYKKGTLPTLPAYEKSTLAMTVLDVISQNTRGAEPPIRIALSAYPLVDIYDPLMNNNCQIDLVRTFNGIEGIMLTHFGSSYERRHYYGTPELLTPYLNYDLTQYIEEKKRDISKKNYGLVLTAAHFPYNNLPELFENYPVELIYGDIGKDGERRHAEAVHRLVKYCTDDTVNDERPPDFPSELDWPPIVVDPQSPYAEEVEHLIKSNIRHSSFDKDWLVRRKHYIIVEKGTESIIAVKGYQGSCVYENHQILIATDLAVAKKYREKHVGSSLSRYTNQVESVKSMQDGKRLIIVADFIDEEVAERYGKVNLGYKFAGTIKDSRFSKSYWIGLQLIQ